MAKLVFTNLVDDSGLFTTVYVVTRNSKSTIVDQISLRVGIIDKDTYGLPKLFRQPLEELSLDGHLNFPVNRVWL